MNKYIIRKIAALSYRFKNVMIMALLSTTILSSCLDENLVYETFREEMMGDFIKNRPEQFSEFQRLLDTTKVMGLVNAYGKFTMFAPDNGAMKASYASKGKSSLAEFSLDTLTKVAYDHIIKLLS